MLTTPRTTLPLGAWKAVCSNPGTTAALPVVPRGHVLGSPRNLAVTTHSPASSPGCWALGKLGVEAGGRVYVCGSEVTRMTSPETRGPTGKP